MTNILNKLKELFYGPPVEPDASINTERRPVVTHKPKISVKGKRKKPTRAKKVKSVSQDEIPYDEVVGRR